MSIVYGPVPSRRLGQSLGVDPIPFKTCNYNCVYCQLGRTTPMTNTREDFFPPEQILSEVQTALAAHAPGEIDYITFVGQGEPSLCASLGSLIRGVQAMTDIPLAIITDGSLLFLPEVREELRVADVVLPTLDAADEATFRKVNRPWPKLHIADIIEGMVAFRQIFTGQLWVEVMLVKGLNDTEEVLLQLRDALARILPDQIHLNTPVRPPAEPWVEPPDDEGMMRATAILGEAAQVVMPIEGAFHLDTEKPLVDAVIDIIRRHPMRETEIQRTLQTVSPEEVRQALAELATDGRGRAITYRGQVFWQFAGGRYGRN